MLKAYVRLLAMLPDVGSSGTYEVPICLIRESRRNLKE